MKLNKQMKTSLPLAAAMGSLILATSTQGAVIISETFSGDNATALVGTTTSDGNDWLGASNSTYMQDGSLSSTSGKSAYLPFTLTQGLIYTLQVDITPAGAGSNWLATGFSLTAGNGSRSPHTNGASTYAWMLLRANADAQTFRGANTSGSASISAWVGDTVTIVLNTTNAADYTVEYFDGSGSRNGPTGIGSAPAIGHIFIGNDGMDGSFDNFTLSDNAAVPEPSTTALLGLGGLALILRRRR